MLTDTHAHLDFPEFEVDFAAMLARAEDAGVRRIITIGTSLESSRRAIELAECHPQIWAAVGVHPNAAVEAPEDVLTPLRELARHPKVVAIGETGLDYYRLPSRLAAHDKAPEVTALGNESSSEVRQSIEDGAIKAAQASVFQQQLDLAVELGLNVIIHERSSWDDTVAALNPYNGKLRAVFHCYGGPIDRARSMISEGHLVSFTGIVTFKNAQIRAGVRCPGAGRFIHGGNGLPFPRARPTSRKAL